MDDTTSPTPPIEGDPNNDQNIRKRKVDHIELCAREDVEYRLKTTLLEEVHLFHQSLPEISFDDLQTETRVFGKTLSMPFCISGMTGGAEQAEQINKQLAAFAQRKGMAFGVGSQRAMMVDPSLRSTYAVRDVAPDILLFANIGVVQATQSSTAELRDLVRAIDADALCVHLNPAQELIQEGGDRGFHGNVDTFKRLVNELDIPIIAKETGCGISPQTAAHLAESGVEWVDVSGAGGTTWVGVEALRARPGRRVIGEDFWEWGIPTAASIVFARQHGLRMIASGGLRNGHDAARAIALGASLCSMALPWLMAARRGEEALEATYERLSEGLKTAMILSGSVNAKALRNAPRILGPNLRNWIQGGM